MLVGAMAAPHPPPGFWGPCEQEPVSLLACFKAGRDSTHLIQTSCQHLQFRQDNHGSERLGCLTQLHSQEVAKASLLLTPKPNPALNDKSKIGHCPFRRF